VTRPDTTAAALGAARTAYELREHADRPAFRVILLASGSLGMACDRCRDWLGAVYPFGAYPHAPDPTAPRSWLEDALRRHADVCAAAECPCGDSACGDTDADPDAATCSGCGCHEGRCWACSQSGENDPSPTPDPRARHLGAPFAGLRRGGAS